jgi:hypothetical protein
MSLQDSACNRTGEASFTLIRKTLKMHRGPYRITSLSSRIGMSNTFTNPTSTVVPSKAMRSVIPPKMRHKSRMVTSIILLRELFRYVKGLIERITGLSLGDAINVAIFLLSVFSLIMAVFGVWVAQRTLDDAKASGREQIERAAQELSQLANAGKSLKTLQSEIQEQGSVVREQATLLADQLKLAQRAPRIEFETRCAPLSAGEVQRGVRFAVATDRAPPTTPDNDAALHFGECSSDLLSYQTFESRRWKSEESRLSMAASFISSTEWIDSDNVDWRRIRYLYAGNRHTRWSREPWHRVNAWPGSSTEIRHGKL